MKFEHNDKSNVDFGIALSSSSVGLTLENLKSRTWQDIFARQKCDVVDDPVLTILSSFLLQTIRAEASKFPKQLLDSFDSLCLWRIDSQSVLFEDVTWSRIDNGSLRVSRATSVITRAFDVDDAQLKQLVVSRGACLIIIALEVHLEPK